MIEPAFQLGQLLAVADVIHVGYCMDVRSSQVPPTLLGNSVLSIAQIDPQRALAVLCRRWKPYWAWVSRPHSEQHAFEEATTDKVSQKTWAIKVAISQANRIKGVADQLAHNLPRMDDADDAFRAKLLLGYIAGLQKTADHDRVKTPENIA